MSDFFFSHNLEKNDSKVYFTNQLNFIDFSKKELYISPPLPLRRVFSLARLMKCDFFICESIDCHKNDFTEGCERAKTCKNFINILKEKNIYEIELVNRICYKISFYKTNSELKEPSREFETAKEIYLDLLSNPECELLGFTMIHVDIFRKQNDRSSNIQVECNLPICFFKPPFSVDYFTTPLQKATLSIKIASVVQTKQLLGQYFSEQNKITNCCAHASIKSALYPCLPSISSKMINQVLNRDHKTARGNEGFNPSEIKTVVEQVSENKLTISFVKFAMMESKGSFWQTVYHAIESRFPVILLLKPLNACIEAHAVTLLGHSLNEHNWWAYGTKGKFGINVDDDIFLSSSLWCNNFIINDDLIGPHYQFPVKFRKVHSVSPLLSKWQQLKRKVVPLTDALYEPIYSLTILPQRLADVWSLIYSGEYEAIAWLYDFIESDLHSSNSKIDALIKSKDSFFNEYFYEYYKTNSLITRIIALTKEEYLTALLSEGYLKDHFASIEERIPSYIWLIEISIPELFWINKRKIGEIVLDPESNNKIILCYLPDVLILKEPHSTVINIHENRNHDRHYKMVTPAGIYGEIIGKKND